jgi:radical SAM-linked protein
MLRLRLKFSRGDKLKFLSHLDMMRLWERSLRRAGMPPCYSEGFSPHPKISLAAPLPVGVTSQAEIMDVFLEGRITPNLFVQKIASHLPDGVAIIDVMSVNLQASSLQSSLRQAEYIVEIDSGSEGEQVEGEIASLLAKDKLAWHHARDTGDRHYDLRALIDNIRLIAKTGNGYRIGMRLRCDSSGSGRPEQVIKALGFDQFPVSVERTNLIFD